MLRYSQRRRNLARHGGQRQLKPVVEATSVKAKTSLTLWPAPGNDFELMRGVKNLFDPGNLLNPGRLYGRL